MQSNGCFPLIKGKIKRNKLVKKVIKFTKNLIWMKMLLHYSP